MAQTDTKHRTYQLVRFSDLLDLDDRVYEEVMAGLPAVIKAARSTRAALRELAKAKGLPDPCPDAAQALPYIKWVDDGKRDIRINVSFEGDGGG